MLEEQKCHFQSKMMPPPSINQYLYIPKPVEQVKKGHGPFVKNHRRSPLGTEFFVGSNKSRRREIDWVIRVTPPTWVLCPGREPGVRSVDRGHSTLSLSLERERRGQQMLRTLFGPLDRASSSSSTQSGKILSENRDRARSEDEKERSSVIVVVLFLSRERGRCGCVCASAAHHDHQRTKDGSWLDEGNP